MAKCRLDNHWMICVAPSHHNSDKKSAQTTGFPNKRMFIHTDVISDIATHSFPTSSQGCANTTTPKAAGFPHLLNVPHSNMFLAAPEKSYACNWPWATNSVTSSTASNAHSSAPRWHVSESATVNRNIFIFLICLPLIPQGVSYSYYPGLPELINHSKS